MQRIWWVFRMGALLALGANAPAVPGAAAAGEVLRGPVPARVVRVVDGDTIIVRARIWLGQEVETRLRLARVDAPEIHGKCPRERELARAARAFLVARLTGGRVTLRDIQYGKFAGRVVARLEGPGGEDLGQAMRAQGLARAYGGGRRQGWC